MPQAIPKEVLAKGMFFIETGQRVGTFTVWKKDIVENPNTGYLPSHIQVLARQCCCERGWSEDEWMYRLNGRIRYKTYS